MSKTFWVPDAPRALKRIPCTYGKGEPWACSPKERCGYCDDGSDEVWVGPAPDLNVNEGTAATLFEILRLKGHDNNAAGTILPSEMPLVRRRIIRALSSVVEGLKARPEAISGGAGTGQALFITCALDIDDIRDRLVRLDAVLVYAQQHQQKVTWG